MEEKIEIKSVYRLFFKNINKNKIIILFYRD